MLDVQFGDGIKIHLKGLSYPIEIQYPGSPKDVNMTEYASLQSQD